MNAAVAIFVKTPGFSPIKTRLAERLGRSFAEDWHRRSATAVAEIVRDSGLEGYWAVAEAGAAAQHAWPGLPNLAQGEGGLGERMARVHDCLVDRHGAAILVGADVPQLTAAQLSRAAGLLDTDRPRQVLGPARDGGFWLFGANHRFARDAWTAVEYSRADTAERLIGTLAPDAAWEKLEPLTDLDQAADLPAVLAELKALRDPHPSQTELTEWLELAAG